MKYLLDTCIWRDYYEERVGKTGNPLGLHAYNLFMKILKDKDTIIFAKSLYLELSQDYSEADIDDMLGFLDRAGRLERVEPSLEQVKEAGDLVIKRDLPFVDCLQAVLARDNCAFMITRDFHFRALGDIASSFCPEEICRTFSHTQP